VSVSILKAILSSIVQDVIKCVRHHDRVVRSDINVSRKQCEVRLVGGQVHKARQSSPVVLNGRVLTTVLARRLFESEPDVLLGSSDLIFHFNVSRGIKFSHFTGVNSHCEWYLSFRGIGIVTQTSYDVHLVDSYISMVAALQSQFIYLKNSLVAQSE
jgi:hypothetical protein